MSMTSSTWLPAVFRAHFLNLYASTEYYCLVPSTDLLKGSGAETLQSKRVKEKEDA